MESYSVSVSGKAKGTTATEGWSVSKPKGTKLYDTVLCIVLPIVRVLLLKLKIITKKNKTTCLFGMSRL